MPPFMVFTSMAWSEPRKTALTWCSFTSTCSAPFAWKEILPFMAEAFRRPLRPVVWSRIPPFTVSALIPPPFPSRPEAVIAPFTVCRSTAPVTRSRRMAPFTVRAFRPSSRPWPSIAPFTVVATAAPRVPSRVILPLTVSSVARTCRGTLRAIWHWGPR